MTKVAFAISAHPDDIEFMMAGTLILLKQAGYEIHYMTVANGSCGSVEHDAQTIARIRRAESRDAAAFIGATYHDSLVDDLEIFYERRTIQRLGAVIREVAPHVVLTHPPRDYMEDHTNTCRLVLAAAFARAMPNYPVDPPTAPVTGPVTIYHALPYGLRDLLGQPAEPDFYVNVSGVMETKLESLAKHRSQKEWLDASQGIDSYLAHLEAMNLEAGHMSGVFQYAEGWTKHLHLGYCAEDADPVRSDLAPDLVRAARPQ